MEMTRRDVLASGAAALVAGPLQAANTPPWGYHLGCLTLSFDVKPGMAGASSLGCASWQDEGFHLPPGVTSDF